MIGSQFLLQLRYRLVFVSFNLPRALLVYSGASAFSHYLFQRASEILWTPDFVDQSEPFSSFNPRFQGCQHALCPGLSFHPCPSGTDLSVLWSPLGHCRRCLFLGSVFHASTFLPPFAPRALPRFGALTKALSPFGHGSSDPLPVMNAVPSRIVIPDSCRSNFRPFYLHPPHALLSLRSLLAAGQVADLPFFPFRAASVLGFAFT